MQIPTTCTGVLRKEEGRLMARGVTLRLKLQNELFGVPAIFTVYDDPNFSRHYVGEKFVFVPSHDQSQAMRVRVIGTDGSCFVVPAEGAG